METGAAVTDNHSAGRFELHVDGELPSFATLVPSDAPGFRVEEYLWTFNMPTDHARISLTDVEVSDADVFGEEGRGLGVVQDFFNEKRIRQAADGVRSPVPDPQSAVFPCGDHTRCGWGTEFRSDVGGERNL